MQCMSNLLQNIIKERVDSICNTISQTEEYKRIEALVIAQRTEITVEIKEDIIKALNLYENLSLQLQWETYKELYRIAYEDGALSRLDLTPNMTPKL